MSTHQWLWQSRVIGTRGIRRKNHGWQAYVRLHGRLVTKQFPREASLAEMQQWRETQIRAATDDADHAPTLERP
jgi:hypothetical protein